MRIITRLKRNQFFGHILSLLTGTTIAQSITILFSPILTRIFTPDDFGQFYVFLVLASFYTITKTASLDKAIIISNSNREASNIFISNLILIILFDLTLTLLYPIINFTLYKLLNINLTYNYFLYFILYSSLLSIIKLLQSFCNHQHKFKSIAVSNIIRAVIITAMQIIFGYFGFGFKGLIYGGAIGLVSAISFLLITNKNDLNPIMAVMSPKKFKSIFRKNKPFFIYETPTTLINEISVQIPLLAFKAFFGQAFAGLYALPQKVLAQPTQILGKSVAEVFFRKAADMEKIKIDQRSIAYNTFKTLFLIGLLPFSLVLLFGELIFGVVFGVEWTQSGIIASALSPWMLFVFAGSPISSIFITKGKLKLSFRLNVVILIFRVLFLSAGIFIFNNFIIAASLFGIVSFVYWFFITIYSLHLCGVKAKVSLAFILKWLSLPILGYLFKLLLW